LGSDRLLSWELKIEYEIQGQDSRWVSSLSHFDPMKILAFYLIVLVLSGLIHFLLRRFWLGVIIGTAIGGAVELFSEIITAPSASIRPVDVLFWGPFVTTQGALFAFPAVVFVGVAFSFARKRSSRRITSNDRN
jgi:hypothetical protein